MKKVYYLYFANNHFQPLENEFLIEKIIKDSYDDSPNGSQIIKMGLTKHKKNACSFLVWGNSSVKVEELLQRGIVSIFEKLEVEDNDELYKSIQQTLGIIEKSSLELRELFF